MKVREFKIAFSIIFSLDFSALFLYNKVHSEGVDDDGYGEQTDFQQYTNISMR